MKWGRILTALIIIFVILNIMLGVGNYKKNIELYRVSEERIKNITGILNDKGILLECELPRYFRPIETIWLEPDEIDTTTRDHIVKNLFGDNYKQATVSKKVLGEPYKEPVLIYTLESEEIQFMGSKITYINHGIVDDGTTFKKNEAMRIGNAFIKKMEKKKYKKEKNIKKIGAKQATLTYYEIYNRLPVFDSYVKLEVTPHGVAYAEVYGASISNKIGVKKPLYPIDYVLFDIDTQLDIAPPFTLEDIQFGYRMNLNEGIQILEEEAFPVLKVVIKGLNEPIFVDAYTK
ncbi:MAG: hypothetical protein ACRCSG_06120 [Cellulosilyticaceae bacterium]